MARSRYSALIEGAKRKPELDRYIQYLQGTLTRPSRVGTRGARPPRIPLYVKPFGFDLTAGEWVTTSGQAAHETKLGGFIRGASGADVLRNLGSGNASERQGFQPATVTFFGRAQRSAQVTRSDITGAEYLKYEGETWRCPFGRGGEASTADLYETFDDIKAAILSHQDHVNWETKRCSLRPERYSYRG